VLDAALDPRDGLPLERVPPKEKLEPDDERFLTDFAYADDICLTAPDCAAAQRQFWSVQREARKVGLEVNCKPGKTEYICVGVTPSPITSIDGAPIKLSEAYTYLGCQPFDLEAHFATRVEKAWKAVHMLKFIWTNRDVSTSRKLSLMMALVVTVFSYGACMLPQTRPWQQRIDRVFLTFIKHCTGQFSHDYDELLQHGKIPRLSSILRQQRIAALGHALRHDEPLGFVACSLYGVNKRRGGQHSTIDLEFARSLDKWPRDQWRDVAEDREFFNTLARVTAAENEDEIAHTYWLRRRGRWLDPIRIDRRTHLRIIENQSFPRHGQTTNPLNSHTFDVPLNPLVKDYTRPARVNVFRSSS
jgi:hypothetical protein